MKKSNIKLIALITIVLLAISLEANAQFPDFDSDTGIDEAVPINGLIYLAMAIGGCLGFIKMKNKN